MRELEVRVIKNIMPNTNLDSGNENTLQENIEKLLRERIVQLEKELQYTRECLQSSNEEFIVYGEELLNSNEELQTVNSELLKANTQNQFQKQELAVLTNDLTNYLFKTDSGTVFLDENLCIRKFTPGITKVLNVKMQDIGRPMRDITNNFNQDELNTAAREALSRKTASSKELQSKPGHWYLLKCTPYSTAEEGIQGVVLSLADITRSKRAEINMQKSKNKYERLVENSPFSIFIIQNGRFCFSNSSGLKLLRLKSLNDLLSADFRLYFNIDINDYTEYQLYGKNRKPKISNLSFFLLFKIN